MAVTRYCTRCGIDRREGDRFCRNCGAPVGTGETRLHDTPTEADHPTAPLPGARASDPARAELGPTDLPPAPSVTAPIPTGGPAGSPAPRPTAEGLPFRPLALGGGVLLALSAVLPWLSSPGITRSALDLPVGLLWDLEAGDMPVKIGFALLAFGGFGAILSFMDRTAWLRRALGILGLIVGAAFAVQLLRLLDETGGSIGELVDAIGVGVYVALAGAVALIVSS